MLSLIKAKFKNIFSIDMKINAINKVYAAHGEDHHGITNALGNNKELKLLTLYGWKTVSYKLVFSTVCQVYN